MNLLSKEIKDVRVNNSKYQNIYVRNTIDVTDIKTKKLPNSEHKIVTFDIETWGLNPSNIALGVFFDGVNYNTSYNKEDITKYLDEIKEPTIIFAHNGAKYDFALFFEEIRTSSKWRMTKTGQIYHFSYTNKNDIKIIFKDSLYLLPSSLDSLSKDLLPKEFHKMTLDDKFKYPDKFGFSRKTYLDDIDKYNRNNVNEYDVKYCKRDTEALYKILTHSEFIDNGFDFKNFNTIASIAYRKLLMNSNNKIIVDSNRDREFIKLYRGGLTDVFKHKNTLDNILCLDYNSHYPGVMVEEFALPNKLIRYTYDEDMYIEEVHNKMVNEWLEMLKKYPNGYSEVEIELKDNLTKDELDIVNRIPLVPLAGMNFFALNDKRYIISIMNVELKNVMRFYNVKPKYSLYSKELFKPFKEYITKIYNQRLEAKKNGHSALAFILKLVMNSAYGRAGLRTQTEGIIEGNFEKIKDFMMKNLDIKIKREKDKGYSYIYEEEMNRMNTIKELYDNNVDGMEILNHIKKFIYDINENEDIGLNIKNLNKIPKENLLNEIEEDIYILSYSSSKIPHLGSCYYLASEITAKARAKLVDDIIDVETSKLGNVCYCDTDSMHIETNNLDELKEYLKDKLDDKKLGYLKDEGTYKKGYWLAKKHYYMFDKKDGYEDKLILQKQALKGFPTDKNIDILLHSQPAVFVNKIYTRMVNINLGDNQILEEKTFLDFNTKRYLDGTLFYLEDETIKISKLKHKNYIKQLYWEIINSGFYVIEKDNSLIKVTKELIENRIKEEKIRIKNLMEQGVYLKSFEHSELQSETSNRRIKQYLKKISNPKKPKKPRKSRANTQTNSELLGIEISI